MRMKKSHLPNIPSPVLLHKLLDALQEVVCVFDTNLKFVYVNKACYKIWGYQPEELIGKSCFDLMVPKEREAALSTTTEAYMGADIPTYENHYIRKDGTIITMFWEGGWDVKDKLLYCTGKDISDRKKLEKMELAYNKKLKRANDQMEQFLERITDGFLGLDKDARINYWNKAATSIAQLPKSKVLGKILWDIIPEQARPIYFQLYQNIKKENRPINTELFSERLQRWIEVSTYVSGSGLSIFFRDVTERKKLVQQLIHEQQQQQKRITAAVIKATENERAAVGKELHDNVNQVLTTVKLYQELCLSNTGNTQQLLLKSIALLQDSINEIRGLSKRLSAPSLGKILLKESVAELVEAINATNRIHIIYQSHINGIVVPDDVHLAIYRIIQEHLTNVLKHAKATKAVVDIDFIGENLLLTIWDNGVGFDTSQKSSGIGIANMESRVEDLNGSIDIASAPGKGCKLDVKIPLLPDPNEASSL